jgi:hypothetical protein
LKAKKAILEVIIGESNLISQWQAFEVFSAAIQMERMRYNFSLSDDEIAILNNRMKDKDIARKN